MSRSEENITIELKEKPTLPSGHLRDILLENNSERCKFFSTPALVALSESCNDLRIATADALKKRRNAQKLMQHVVYGQQEEAEAMIKADPSLLLIKSQAIDYSGRTIVGTPFQAALGAEDEWMWEMMKPYFVVLDSTGAIDSAQFETWDDADKFWKEVIGFVQRQMPTNYAQVHCSGIDRVLGDAGAFKRKLNFSDGGKFFPLSADAVGLGFDFAVYSGYGRMLHAERGGVRRRGSTRGCAYLLSYVEQKQHHLSVLSESLNQHPKSLVTL